MNALELRKYIEEKAAMILEHRALTEHCAGLEEECSRYERDLKRFMEACDELGKENDALQECLLDNSVVRLVDEIGSLKQDKQQMRINLCRAEDEVKALFEENKLLDQENRRLLRQLKKERQHQETDDQHSAGACVEGKPKSTLKEGNPEQAPDPRKTGPPRQPLSPLQHN
ncbi:Eea1 homodimerization domain-containing protein [Dioscorea alata]|nr:Eea1 homodimerization domain-containing protein [Dioscorea alata]